MQEAMGKTLEWEPRLIAFLCQWCSYTGADFAGVNRLQYPPNVRIIRVPCAGRISPLLILRSLQSGADGVLVLGCPPDNCHYISGSITAGRKLVILNNLLEYIGMEKGRVSFFFHHWVSAAEGKRFDEVIKECTEKVRALGPAHKLVKKLV